MTEINSDDFCKWIKGEDVKLSLKMKRKNFTKETEGSPLFVVVKTSTCPKCAKLESVKEQIFGDQVGLVAQYVFDPRKSAPQILELFSTLGMSSAPALIFRYFNNNIPGLYYQTVDADDDFIELKNIFDAINENDYKYFGFNEFDEAVDSDANPAYLRLLHLIHGEIDPIKLHEHKSFVKSLKN